MKKIFFILLLFSCPAWALVAPRLYMVDLSCPKNAPFRETQWHNYENKEGGYYTPVGNCISCDTTKGLMMMDAKDCALCPNRTTESVDTIAGFITSNYCRLKKCPQDKPFYEEDWNWSGCKNCQDKPKHIKKEECEQCPNMRWVEGAGCAPEKNGRMYYNGTFLTAEGMKMHMDGGSAPFDIDCDSGTWKQCEAVKTSEQECKKCPFTYMKNGFCHMDGWKKINTCSDGYIRNMCGFCFPCDYNEEIRTTKEYCDACPNREYIEKCILKNK